LYAVIKIIQNVFKRDYFYIFEGGLTGKISLLKPVRGQKGIKV